MGTIPDLLKDRFWTWQSWKVKNDIVNFLKTKANLENSQRKITYTEKKHFQTVDFLSETVEVRRQWNILFKGLKEKSTGNQKFSIKSII